MQAIESNGLPAALLPLPEIFMQASDISNEVGVARPSGNEGAGTVVAAGSSDEAQALMGKTVVIVAPPSYAQYTAVDINFCIPMPDGIPPIAVASAFVNPLTALSMVDTMRHEGHKALVHTAAASNLGQMLAKICVEDNVDLVAIVRSQAQADILENIGTKYICNSSLPSFEQDLTDALVKSGATIAFDAIAGGEITDKILACMEAAQGQLNPQAKGSYGTSIHKQIYIYGGLDFSPSILKRNYGMRWSISGYLLHYFIDRVGQAGMQPLIGRILQGLDSTFKSNYAGELSLAEAVDPTNIAKYRRMKTGEKYLIRPHA
jgi:NADPH:quinone reductase-like Zn-dependent oxidoreductase